MFCIQLKYYSYDLNYHNIKTFVIKQSKIKV